MERQAASDNASVRNDSANDVINSANDGVASGNDNDIEDGAGSGVADATEVLRRRVTGGFPPPQVCGRPY